MVIRTEEGKEIEFEIAPTEDKEKPKIKAKKRVKTGAPKGARGPPISDSGGYCSYGEKDWEVELDENYNPTTVSVEGTSLNVDYKVWW